MTPESVAPDGWDVFPFGELCCRKGEYGANVSKAAFDPSLPRYLRITDIDEDGRLNSRDLASISEDAAAQYLLEDGDILLARSGATVGKSYLHRARDGRLAFAGYLIRFRTQPDRLLPDYIAQYFHSPAYLAWVKDTQRAQAQPNINAFEYADLLVPVPPIPEQRKIAAILSSVDDAIEKTQAVVDQLQVVKKAMMQELLTRGLPGRHTRFKMTEIGEVPESWEVVSVEEVGAKSRPTAQTGPFGAQLSPRDFTDHGVPVLKIGNVRWGYIDHTNLDFLSEDKARELVRFRVRKGDLLFARQGATTGRNALADDLCEGAIINYHIIRVAVDTERCLPEWLAICFNSDLVQRQVGREKVRGNRDGINTSNILSFRFPLAGLAEQAQMVRVLGDNDDCRVANEAVLEGLKLTKSALMSVLLTGEVRVKVDSADITRSVAAN